MEVDIILSPVEQRVLGSLIEKENTTPEYYPLSLNSLTAACNQKSNRWPASDYEEHEVSAAIGRLRTMGFAAEITGGSRVPKYAQRFTEKLNLGRRETALVCVLLLRGHQTLGELRSRTERMYSFSDPEEIEMVLQKFPEMIKKLPPSPGLKEPRYAHLLGGPVEQAMAPERSAQPADRMAALEGEVARLSGEVAELRRRLDEVL